MIMPLANKHEQNKVLKAINLLNKNRYIKIIYVA